MNTMGYLHSHLVWLKLSVLSIVDLPFACLAAHDRKSLRWTTPETSNFYCLPGRAGGTLYGRLANSPPELGTVSPNDTAVQRRTGEGAKRPTRSSAATASQF